MRYIDADKVMEEVNRIGGHNLCEWQTIGVKALIDRQPTADVVPKSEYDVVVSALDNSTQEFLRLHDDYQEAKREVENLKVLLEMTEKDNEGLKELYRTDIDALVEARRKTEFEVAREIDDIKRYIIFNENISRKCKAENGEQNKEYWKGKLSAFLQVRGYIEAELKKKYT